MTSEFVEYDVDWLKSLEPQRPAGFMDDVLACVVMVAPDGRQVVMRRTDAERLFIVVYNTYTTATLTNGQGVIWDFATDKDGLGVTRPTARATNAGMAGAGIIAESIASGGYGLMQVYGYHSAVRMRTVTGGTPAIVGGRPLVINVAGSVFCLESVSTASTAVLTFPMGFSLSATAGFTTAAQAAFIRAM